MVGGKVSCKTSVKPNNQLFAVVHIFEIVILYPLNTMGGRSHEKIGETKQPTSYVSLKLVFAVHQETLWEAHSCRNYNKTYINSFSVLPKDRCNLDQRGHISAFQPWTPPFRTNLATRNSYLAMISPDSV